MSFKSKYTICGILQTVFTSLTYLLFTLFYFWSEKLLDHPTFVGYSLFFCFSVLYLFFILEGLAEDENQYFDQKLLINRFSQNFFTQMLFNFAIIIFFFMLVCFVINYYHNFWDRSFFFYVFQLFGIFICSFFSLPLFFFNSWYSYFYIKTERYKTNVIYLFLKREGSAILLLIFWRFCIAVLTYIWYFSVLTPHIDKRFPLIFFFYFDFWDVTFAELDLLFLPFYDSVFLILSRVLLILPILLIVAFYTLSERKIMGAVQRRRGPNVTGFFGILQPIADGVKLILKEPIIPRKANFFLFFLAPIITFSLSFSLWSLLPNLFFFFLIDSNLSLLILFAISSLSIFGIIGAGWASNSKYALLGSLRSASQMISYEISLGFIFISVSLLAESVNIFDIFLSQYQLSNLFPLFPLALVFFISALAETNRAPFDLPEAEAEIVAGYNVEYSGITFALFFLGEYSNMFIMSMLFVFLFWGGNLGTGFFDIFIFIFKVNFIALLFIFIRAILPRVRYDQLMYLGWQIFLPFTLGYLILVSAIFFVDDLFFYWTDVNYSMLFFDLITYF